MASLPIYTPDFEARPSCAPNIRVAFADGVVVAVEQSLGALPAAVCAATLDDLADKQVSLRELLKQRNQLAIKLNDGPDLEEEPLKKTCEKLNELENRVLGTSAASSDDAVIKLIALAQVAAEGHEVDDVEAGSVIADARRFFDAGYIHRSLLDQMPSQVAPTPASDPFMRGPMIQWQYRYARYEEARDALRDFDRDDHAPAVERFLELRAKYPVDYNFKDDPAAAAELEAIGLDASQARFDELVADEHDAIDALYRNPAPSGVELAIKLKLFEEQEGWALSNAAEAIRQMTIDARRFARVGAHIQTDRDLLTAFSGIQGIAADWLTNGAYGDERDDAADERASAIEDVIWKTRATTIEGVLVRLRATFRSLAGYEWSERAVLDPTHPQFREGLGSADGNHQALWSCIEDLARISGNNLNGAAA